jgi:hypothetical protein
MDAGYESAPSGINAGATLGWSHGSTRKMPVTALGALAALFAQESLSERAGSLFHYIQCAATQLQGPGELVRVR